MSAPAIRLGTRRIDVRPGESVLDACLRSGVALPFSCRGGVCGRCALHRACGDDAPVAPAGGPSDAPDAGVLACQCVPGGEMSLRLTGRGLRRLACEPVQALRTGDFLWLRLHVAAALPQRPGDTLWLDDGRGGVPLELTAVDGDGRGVEALLRLDGAEPPAWADRAQAAAALSVLLTGAALPDSVEQAPPAADPALWAELGGVSRVRDILTDFYAEVYRDARLAPYFGAVTMVRAIEKQTSFLHQLMTGERVFFGDRPRNAHHWMVVGDALFDHRQALMVAVLRRHDLSEGQIARWTRFELHYRRDIVKQAPWPRRVGDSELPADGFGEEVLAEGSLCDHCGAAVDAGTRVRYHLRLGTISCPACAGSASRHEVCA